MSFIYSASGCTDYFAQNEPEAFEMGRDIVSSLNVKCNIDLDIPDYDEPLYDSAEIPSIVPPSDELHSLDMYPVGVLENIIESCLYKCIFICQE